MRKTRYLRLSIIALIVGLIVFVAVPGPASAQLPLPGTGTTSSQVIGSAAALQATVLGTTTALASTGSLGNGGADELGADAVDASIPSVGSAEAPRAATGGEGDPVDTISSDASLGNLALTVEGFAISADFVMAQALAMLGTAPVGWSELDNLTVNGVSIVPTGAANQTISLGAITLVLNEVQQTATGITVNALHITSLDGLVDVVVASATAGIQ